MRHWSIDDDRPGQPRRSYARRHFWHWGPDGEHDAHVDVYLNRPKGHGWGFALRFDGPNAETPIDVGLFLGRWAYVFAGTSKGARLNRWLRRPAPTEANRYNPGNRCIEFRVAGNLDGMIGGWTNLTVQWLLWADNDHQVFGKWQERAMRTERGPIQTWLYAHTQRGYWHPFSDLADAVLGKRTYTDEEITAPQRVTAHLDDGPYLLDVAVHRQTWKRPRSPRGTVKVSAEYTVVPVKDGGRGYAESSYKWGGDGLVSSNTRDLTPYEAADPAKWAAVAVASFTEHVLKDRARNGWQLPDQYDTTPTITV